MTRSWMAAVMGSALAASKVARSMLPWRSILASTTLRRRSARSGPLMGLPMLGAWGMPANIAHWAKVRSFRGFP